MSGVVSGITKIFKPIAQVATRVLLPAVGVGASLFTGGASMGLPGLLMGGLKALTGIGGAFGNVANVAGGRMGVDPSAFAYEGMAGAQGGAQGGDGLFSASSSSNAPLGQFNTAPGMVAPQSGENAPASSPITQQMMSQPAKGNQFFQSLQGGGLLSGLGSGIQSFMAAKQQQDMFNAGIASRERMQDKEFQHLNDKEQRVRDSYSVSDRALHGRTPRYRYDPETGSVVS
jgi:hypothetical protein